MMRERVPEVWAGVECTVNRLGDRFLDQLARTGHRSRRGDLARFADLGVRAIRYPVLWETTAPEGPSLADWRFADERLGLLRDLGIRPIVGLVHHGSGPRWTSLLEPSFATGLAEYARAVAARYPWIGDFTPVNEPLTTARFSALYGHWYPHARGDREFACAVVVQCRAIALAMRAIREVTPGARLIQTEDTGRTFATPALEAQAAFENERRWLAIDLLCGRVTRAHPLHGWLTSAGGLDPAELAWFVENATPPDLVGLNYYVTSDRFLDERLERYPAWSHGGNAVARYADMEAARARPEGILGHRAALEAALDRTGLPVALTEVHLGGAREDQLRWLAEAWRAAVDLRREGRDVRAITVWSLLGAFDWNTLVTCEAGFYEPGPFDVRAPNPRATAIAAMTRGLATEGRFEHAVLADEGWWRRSGRLIEATRPPPADAEERLAGPPILIAGAGTLARAFARLCAGRGLAYIQAGRAEMDIAEPRAVRATLERHRPWAVVNAAGYVRVDEAEAEPARCFRENALGPLVLAETCAAHGVRLVTFSSDLVFDGDRAAPYLESDVTRPLNVYGRSKVAAEELVLARQRSALVIRTGAFFGPWDRANFVTLALGALARGEPFRAADDLVVSPTYVPDLVHVTLDLLIDGEEGLWHLTNRGELTWAALARRAALEAGLDPGQLRGCRFAELGLAAPRPRFSALGSERAALLGPVEDALRRWVRECETGILRGGGAACGCS